MARIGTAFIEISGDFGPLRRQLAEMRSTKDLAIKVEIDKGSAAKLTAEKNKLASDKKIEYKVDFDEGPFTRARKAIAATTKESNLLSDVFNRSSLSIGQQTSLLTLFSSQVTGLAGALGALTASLGAATAGIGALAVGAGAAGAVGLSGIAAIAVPAIKSLQNLMTAQTAVNKARATGAGSAARASVSSANSIKSAEDSVTSAEEGLANAQRQVTFAQQALTLARQDATRQLQDMKRAAVESTTAEARGRLGIQQAEANLAQVRLNASSTALDIRDAELSVTEARQSNRDTQIQAKRAQDDYNKAQKKGVDQMPQVVAAQRSLADSQRGVVDAQRGLTQATQGLAQAQQQANMQAQAGARQYAALALAQKKAGPLATEFAHRLKAVSHEFHGLTAAGREDFFGLLNDGIKRVQDRLPLLAKSANSSMHALRVGVDQFLNRVMGPEFNHFVEVMTRTFANALPPTLRALGNIGLVLERIAVAVAPDIVRMTKGFEEMTANWAKSTSKASDLRDTVHALVNQTHAWWQLLTAATQLIIAVLVPGMGQGKKAVEGMTASLQEWTRWVNAHPKEIRNFMKEGLQTTSQLFEVLSGFLPTFLQLADATRPISKGFLSIVNALNSVKIGPWKLLTELILGLIITKNVVAIFNLAKGIRAVATAVGLLGAAEAGAGGAGALRAGASLGAAATGFGSGTAAKTVTGRIIGSSGVGVAEGAAGGAGLPVLVVGATAGAAVALGAANAKAFKDGKIAIPVPGGGGGSHGFGGLPGGDGSFNIPAPKIKFALPGSADDGELLANVMGFDLTKGREQIVKQFQGKGPGFFDPATLEQMSKVPGAFDQITEALGNAKKSDREWFLENVRTWKASGALSKETANKLIADTQRVVDQRQFLLGRRKGLGFADALAKDRKLSGDEIAKMLKQLGKLPEGARKEASNTMVGMAKVLEDKGKLPEGSAKLLRTTLGTTWKGMKLDGIKQSGKMAKGIADNATALVNAVSIGLDILQGNVKQSLKAFGVKALKFFTHPKKAGHLLGTVAGVLGGQRGMVVPGTGSGDKVPVRAMVEPGEVLAVMNRNAAKKFMEWNAAFPRFQRGGFTGMQPGITALAKLFLKRFGGSMSSGFRPGDPGFHGRGLAADIVPGNWNAATRYANTIGPKLLEGIHQGPPGQNVSWDSGHQVPPAFWTLPTWNEHVSHIHLAIGKAIGGAFGAAAQQVGRILLKGPKGPLRDMGQAALDKVRNAANKFIAKQAPAMSTDVAVGKGVLSRGEMRKLMRAHKMPDIMGWIAASESGFNPAAFNKSGASGLWQIMMPLHRDIVHGNVFDPNVNAEAAMTLFRQSGLSPWAASQAGWGSHVGQPFRKGGILGPFVGAFGDGGFVDQTGLGLLHQGETVIPNLQHGGTVSRLQDEAQRIRQHARRVERRLEKEAGKLHPDKQLLKHLEKLEKRLTSHEATIHELITEQKEIHRDSKERNRLLREIRANEKGGMKAVSNFIASDIGYRQRQKTRQASAGSVARY